MIDKEFYRNLIRDNIYTLSNRMNVALRGEGIERYEPALRRLARDGKLPHWYLALRQTGCLPNLDGKTIGSVIEMLFAAVIENTPLNDIIIPQQRINPARGVDLPDLDLGVKSPSENFCTSEPFFSAYERILGGENDVVVFLTDYQKAKKSPPLRLQIINAQYLNRTRLADESLCNLARHNREWLLLENESWARKFFRFLAYVNQSDWRARQLLRLIPAMRGSQSITTLIDDAEKDYKRKNIVSLRHNRNVIPEEDLYSIKQIVRISPPVAAIIDALDNWVIDTWKDAARAPSEQEWRQFKNSPLDGAIGMSFALQWRFNFAKMFGEDIIDD